jgi:hypothetical protein
MATGTGAVLIEAELNEAFNRSLPAAQIGEDARGGDAASSELAGAHALAAWDEAALQEPDSTPTDARERFRLTEQRLRRALAWTEQLAADRLTLLQAERQLRLEAEAKLAGIVRSTTWRATGPLRALFAKVARLRRGLGAG